MYTILRGGKLGYTLQLAANLAVCSASVIERIAASAELHSTIEHKYEPRVSGSDCVKRTDRHPQKEIYECLLSRYLQKFSTVCQNLNSIRD